MTRTPEALLLDSSEDEVEGRSFDEINDIPPWRIMVEEEAECYTVIGHVVPCTSMTGRFNGPH